MKPIPNVDKDVLRHLHNEAISQFEQYVKVMIGAYSYHPNSDLKGAFNHLPHMAILGSSNSTANKDMMSKIWTNADTVI